MMRKLLVSVALVATVAFTAVGKCCPGGISLDGRWDFAFEEKATLASANADFEATAKVAVPGCFDLMPEWYARRGLAHYRGATGTVPGWGGVLAWNDEIMQDNVKGVQDDGKEGKSRS